jgi:branched-chain amino acid transport system ATP-binding protein
MSGSETPFLDVVGATVGYGKVPVVKEASLDVSLGEIVLVMGPNGAGKSTLVKAVTGELRLLAGRLLLGGLDVTRRREEDRVAAGIGYVPQTRDVFAPLTVLENLQMGGFRLRAGEVSSRVDEVLELFPQLGPLRRRTAKTLSGGERKMVAIARALMADPRLLILDEPTSNLAPQVAASVLEKVVARVADAGRAVLLIEQRVSLALDVATRGYVLTDGRVRLHGSAEELRTKHDLGALFLGRGGVDIAQGDVPEHASAERSG